MYKRIITVNIYKRRDVVKSVDKKVTNKTANKNVDLILKFHVLISAIDRGTKDKPTKQDLSKSEL